MTAVPLANARQDLDKVLTRVLSDAEPVVVEVGEVGSVVIMPLDDFNAWQETAYLLKSPANAARLRESFEQFQRGQFAKHPLDES
jgi:antitoxin YefM